LVFAKKNIIMKKLLLLFIVAFSYLATDAQAKKGRKKHSKKASKVAIKKAKFAKQEAAKKIARAEKISALYGQDSARMAFDKMYDLQKDSESIAYYEAGKKYLDSSFKARYKVSNERKIAWDKAEKNQADIVKAAKLNSYQSQQVRYINFEFSKKANLLDKRNDMVNKNYELSLLNNERRNKIKIIVGKYKERKIEKIRKKINDKNGADEETAWIDYATNYMKN
jgi:hypothetical protein